MALEDTGERPAEGPEDAAEEGADGGEHQLVGGEHPVPAHHAQAGHLPRLLVQHRQLHLRLLQSGAQHLHVKISEEYSELHWDRKYWLIH